MARRKKTTTETTLQPIQAAAQSQPIYTAADVDRDRIASRAYELYMERGGGHGRDMDDWLEAEAELVRGRRVRD